MKNALKRKKKKRKVEQTPISSKNSSCITIRALTPLDTPTEAFEVALGEYVLQS